MEWNVLYFAMAMLARIFGEFRGLHVCRMSLGFILPNNGMVP